MTEVEAILNSRPLTYLSSTDLQEVLTPHFLIGRRVLSIPDGAEIDENDPEFDVSPADLTRRMSHLNGLLHQFWKRWKSEYLLELRDCHRYNTGNPNARPVLIGDLVLVHDEQPRCLWRLAKVVETLPGRDGKIRGALLKVASATQPTTLRRPVQLLYPLEINAPTEPSENFQIPQSLDLPEKGPDPVENPSRPKRGAAVRAREQVKEWMEDSASDQD